MASLKGPVVGLPSGKCGDIVYRIRYGESFMYKACQDFHKSESDASRAIRERMLVMAEFGSIVRSIPELYTIWKKSKVKAKAAYHKIQKFNAKIFDRKKPTINNRIVPDFGFLSPVSEIEFDSLGLYIKTETDKLSETQHLIKKFIAINVICVYEPISSEKKYFELFALRKDLGLCLTAVPLEINFQFEEEISQLVSGYKKGIVYFELVPVDESGNPLIYSEYYSHEFDLEKAEEVSAVQDGWIDAGMEEAKR
jgi:hypothetical protein